MKHKFNIMLNQLKNIIYSLVLLVLVGACSDDFLELTPKVNALEANSYQTEDDAFEALVAVYNALAVQPWIHVPLQSDVFSDDLYTGGEPGGGMGQYQEQEKSIISLENSAATDLWNKLYSGIYRANFFLYKEGDIEWKDQNKRSRMHAEALALRGYFYWDLARHYGWVPVILETIPDVEAYKSLQQSSPEKVYQVAINDLLTAIPNLPETVGANDKGRITKDVARMLIARMYLYYEGFVKKVMGVSVDLSDGAGTVINEVYVRNMVDEILNSGRYQLLDNYADVFDWANENTTESIFEWQYSEKAFSNDWGGWGIRGNFSVVFFGPRDPKGDPSIVTGWSFGTVCWSLYNEFEAGDPRRDVTIYNANTNLSGYTKGFQNTGYFNYKYMPRADYLPSGGGTPDHNWPVNYKDMRLAELYLIGAELHLASNPTKAASYLNEVRVRAMGESARLATITLDDIYHERRVELAAEGHRKWDLLRRGLDYTKTKINASWVIPANADGPGDFEGRQFLENTWGMLPIPASEIRLANPGVLKQHVPAFL
jgi:starch-binding outer membrane protein, SusD/RagB family